MANDEQIQQVNRLFTAVVVISKYVNQVACTASSGAGAAGLTQDNISLSLSLMSSPYCL